MSRQPRLPVKVHLPLVLDEQVTLIRKRSAAIIGVLGLELRERGFDVVIEHLHVHLPRVLEQGRCAQ